MKPIVLLSIVLFIIYVMYMFILKDNCKESFAGGGGGHGGGGHGGGGGGRGGGGNGWYGGGWSMGSAGGWPYYPYSSYYSYYPCDKEDCSTPTPSFTPTSTPTS